MSFPVAVGADGCHFEKQGRSLRMEMMVCLHFVIGIQSDYRYVLLPSFLVNSFRDRNSR
jgi:hypothetical protein